MKYEQLCKDIIQQVGGKENISFVTHCMTRLRMNVKDQASVNQEALKKVNGVLGCQFSGGQFQVIIGQHVDEVYKDFIQMTGLESQKQIDENLDDNKKKFSIKDLPNQIIDAVSGCVTPILPIITATGIIKLIAALLSESMLNILPATNDFMVLLTFVGNAGFYFFPIFVAWAASKKFKTNTPIAMFLAAVLIHPTLLDMVSNGTAFTVYGIPMTLVNYTSQFLPSILIVWVMSYVYGFIDKISPKSLKIILVPTCTMFIMLPIALCIVGPIANLLGQGLAAFFTGLYQLVGPLAIGLIGASWYFLVATGMHQALIALATTMIANMGADNVILVGAKAGSYALMGLAVAYFFRAKKQDKAIASANAITLLVGGISEPTIFTVLLRYKKAMFIQAVSGLVGGIVLGFSHVSIYFVGASNILTGVAFGKDIVVASVGCAVSFITAVILGTVIGFDNVTKKDVKEDANTIVSPMNGTIIPLTEVKDNAFASGSMGEGCAIIPNDGEVVAPFNGTVEALFPTKHAIGLKSDDGVEVLIHIGLDTVNDKGESFTAYVQMSDRITKGQKLISFDKQKLEEKGYDLTTPIILTDGTQIESYTKEKQVHQLDAVFEMKEKKL